jgi:predicted AAA+ superfamily ATPase
MRYLRGEILRLLQDERRMAFIVGPRQAGKTTLAKSLLPTETDGYFNWDIESHRRMIVRSPEDFWRPPAPPATDRPRLVLDEIHKYPRWKRFLKGLYDAAGRDADILVTGSGHLNVFQKGGDSLLGRYGLYHLHPFTVGEMIRPSGTPIPAPAAFWESVLTSPPPTGAAEALASIERFSGFPEPLYAQNTERLRRWRRMRRRLVTREDLRDLTRIRDIGLVDTLVLFLPDRIGSPLSLNALSQTLGVAYNTVQGWVRALEQLYYLFEIRPFAGRLARTLRREAKVYLFDGTEIPDEGPRFENTVALHLAKLVHAWTDRGDGDFTLHYVRDKEKHEVDFLIAEEGRPHLLLEAKSGRSDVSPSLRYFKERLKPRYTVQLVRQVSPDTLQRWDNDAWILSAERLLGWI